MNPFDFLSSVYESATGAANEAAGSLGELAGDLLDNFDDGLEAFIDQAQALLDEDAGAMGDLHEALIALLAALLEADADDTRVRALLERWLEVSGTASETLIDLLERLFGAFSGQAALLLRAVGTLLELLGDFDELLLSLFLQATNQPAQFRAFLEAVLLPVTVAGLASLGPDKVAKAIALVLRNDATSLNRHVTAFELGLPAAGLSAREVRAIERLFPSRAGGAMVALLLDGLRAAAGLNSGLSAALPVASVFLPVTTYFTGIVLLTAALLEALLFQLAERLLALAEDDLFLEMRLLEIARFTPIGLLFFKVALITKLATSPAPWLRLAFNSIEDDLSLRVKRLPRPSSQQKYFILSDIHRDAKSDERPPFEFGSIHHFRPNADLFAEVLEYLDKEDYTIIEAGDCEELWFFRDFPFDPAAKLVEIVNDTHAAVYDRLARLHREGRYFRLFGNHDSYLRNPEVFAILEQRMNPDGSAPFEIFDFAIIDSVKTMHDVPFYLGLDSDPNADTMPFIVTHGHQWDFWNCDENAILGKLIVTMVVTPLDMLDDPVRNLAGISGTGSPMANFKVTVSNAAVFSSWPNYEPGVVLLDQVQHMADRARRFTDDIQYSETLAALMGMLIAVQPSPGDDPLVGLPGGQALCNLLCIGHTHNPHNEPYFDLKTIPYVREPILALQELVNSLAGNPGIELGLVKSLFLNSGVSGWIERCVCGIDLGNESHGTGQPKLVYWTHNTRPDRPNHMDWELPHVPRDGALPPGDELKRLLDELFGLAAGRSPAAQLSAGYQSAAPAARLTAAAAAAWKPWQPALRFDGKGTATLSDLLAHIALGMLASAHSGRKLASSATVQLPPALARQLAAALKDPLLPSELGPDLRLAAAINLLTLERELLAHGFRRGPAVAPDEPERAALAALRSLADLRRGPCLSVDLALSGETVAARIALYPPEGARAGLRLPKFPPADEAPRPGQPAAGPTDLVVRVFARDGGTALAGLKVQLERSSPLGAKQRRVVLAARVVPADGYAILRSAVAARVVPDTDLVVYAPDKSELYRAAIAPELARGVRRLSVPLALDAARLATLLGRKKRPTPEARLAELCGRWQKRLSNPRDPHARDDLCLTDYVLGSLAALESPRNDFQKRLAGEVRQRTKDAQALKGAARLARDLRGGLRKCLGDDMPDCRLPGSLKDLGRHLLKSNERLASVRDLLESFIPDPSAALGDASAGRGIPNPDIPFNKICRLRYEQGELDAAASGIMADVIAAGGILTQPSVNIVRTWEGGEAGGLNLRTSNLHAKILTVHELSTELALDDHDIDLDVEVDDPACLVKVPDATGRQTALTDVRAGQKVTLFGSGFVSATARLTVRHQPWQTDLDDGLLIPSDVVLPVPGFSNTPLDVHGSPTAVQPGTDPETHNEDVIVFEWPAAAAAPGVYRLTLEFDNDSEFPTGVTQDPADCSLVVSRDPVSTEAIVFVVLPAPETPAFRVIGESVDCVDLTDPENFLGVPLPDDLFFTAEATRHRIEIDFAQNSAETVQVSSRSDDASTLLWGPGTWSPALRVFPANAGFGELGVLEFLTANFQLNEVEGDFDRAVVSILFVAAVIAITLLIAAAIVAIVVALVLDGTLTYGLATTILTVVLGFVFGAMFTALAGLLPALIAGVNGSDPIVSDARLIDGASAAFNLSPVRFHRALWNATGFELEDEIENSALGGTYRLGIRIDVS